MRAISSLPWRFALLLVGVMLAGSVLTFVLLASRAPEQAQIAFQGATAPAQGDTATRGSLGFLDGGWFLATIAPQEQRRLYRKGIERRVLAGAGKYVGKDVFADFLALCNSPAVRAIGPDDSKPIITNVAFVKTHKTGSSTLASVLFRLAARRDLRVLRIGSGTEINADDRLVFLKRMDQTQRYNMSFQHIVGPEFTRSLPAMVYFYNSAIQSPRVFSIVREPISHAISWICYYYAPQTIEQISTYATETLPFNVMLSDFGGQHRDDVHSMLAYADSNLDVMCISEDFDRCLVMLRRLYNWSMLDITYMKIMDSGKDLVRYDGVVLMHAPHPEDLPEETIETIRGRTRGDKLLYDAIAKRWHDLVARQDDSFHKEVEIFLQLQSSLSAACEQHEEHPACVWHSLNDMDFLGLVDEDGFAADVSFTL